MSLSPKDLQNIKSIIKTELKPLSTKIDKIEKHIASIDKRLETLEKWNPVENTYLVKPVKKQATQPASASA